MENVMRKIIEKQQKLGSKRMAWTASDIKHLTFVPNTNTAYHARVYTKHKYTKLPRTKGNEPRADHSILIVGKVGSDYLFYDSDTTIV